MSFRSSYIWIAITILALSSVSHGQGLDPFSSRHSLDEFAITTPRLLDEVTSMAGAATCVTRPGISSNGRVNNNAMSPDHWGTPARQMGPTTFRSNGQLIGAQNRNNPLTKPFVGTPQPTLAPAPNATSATSTPSSSTPFKSASFGRAETNPEKVQSPGDFSATNGVGSGGLPFLTPPAQSANFPAIMGGAPSSPVSAYSALPTPAVPTQQITASPNSNRAGFGFPNNRRGIRLPWQQPEVQGDLVVDSPYYEKTKPNFSDSVAPGPIVQPPVNSGQMYAPSTMVAPQAPGISAAQVPSNAIQSQSQQLMMANPNYGPMRAPKSKVPGAPEPPNIIDPGKLGGSNGPDLGFRSGQPTNRNYIGAGDQGQKFDFEQKKTQYPPMSEILSTGRYFGSFQLNAVQPHFQGNTAIFRENATDGVSVPFDFDYEAAPQFKLGFESKYGPGIQLSYNQFDHSSNTERFTSDGVTTGTTSVYSLGSNSWTRLVAANPGETLSATHDFELHQVGVSFFKELQFKISRLNGIFGFQYVSINQKLDSQLTDSTGVIGNLLHESDMRAYGPRIGFEYFRPVGHTKLELVTSFGGSVLFGERDQFISNTQTPTISRVGADEFITVIDFSSGLQYKHMVGENRYVIARLGFLSQTWLGGGTAVLPQDDFGIRGISFGIGYNR